MERQKKERLKEIKSRLIKKLPAINKELQENGVNFNRNQLNQLLDILSVYALAEGEEEKNKSSQELKTFLIKMKVREDVVNRLHGLLVGFITNV